MKYIITNELFNFKLQENFILSDATSLYVIENDVKIMLELKIKLNDKRYNLSIE